MIKKENQKDNQNNMDAIESIDIETGTINNVKGNKSSNTDFESYLIKRNKALAQEERRFLGEALLKNIVRGFKFGLVVVAIYILRVLYLSLTGR